MGIEVESEYSATGLGEYFLRRTVSIHPHDATAGNRCVELAITGQGDVLGPLLAPQCDQVEIGELGVGGMRAGVSTISWRIPRDGLDRHWPEDKVCGQTQQ